MLPNIIIPPKDEAVDTGPTGEEYEGEGHGHRDTEADVDDVHEARAGEVRQDVARNVGVTEGDVTKEPWKCKVKTLKLSRQQRLGIHVFLAPMVMYMALHKLTAPLMTSFIFAGEASGREVYTAKMLVWQERAREKMGKHWSIPAGRHRFTSLIHSLAEEC